MCYYDSARKAFADLGTFHGLPHHTTRDIYLLFWDDHCDYLTPNASPNVPTTIPCASVLKKKAKSTMKDAVPEPEEVLAACSTFECCLEFLPFNNEPEPLFFTKDGNRCHCCALLDAIIFPSPRMDTGHSSNTVPFEILWSIFFKPQNTRIK